MDEATTFPVEVFKEGSGKWVLWEFLDFCGAGLVQVWAIPNM